jgi:hypothetical protein
VEYGGIWVWLEGSIQGKMNHGMTLAGRPANQALKVVKGGLGNERHTSGTPEPGHDQPLEPDTESRSLALSAGIPHGASDGQEIVAGHNAATWINAKGIEGVAVISDVNQVKRSGTQHQPQRKKQELVNVSKIFVYGRRQAREAAHPHRRLNERDLISTVSVRADQKLRNTNHALLLVSWIIAKDQDATRRSHACIIPLIIHLQVQVQGWRDSACTRQDATAISALSTLQRVVPAEPSVSRLVPHA